MKAWIVKNWFLLVILVALIVIFIFSVESCVERINYKKQIRALNQENVFLKQDIKKEGDRARAAEKEAREAVEGARLDRAERDKYKARILAVEREKEGLRERIEALPPTKVVIRIVELLYLPRSEVTLEERGALFTLLATRRCLEELEGFSFIKKQYGDLQFALSKSEASEAKLLTAVAKKDIALASKDKQLRGWELAEVNWNEKFTLSEKRGKKARSKGRKEGGIFGFLLGLAAGFFLDR